MIRPRREDVMTAVRVVACIGLFWLLFPHDLTHPMVLGALVTMLCLLAVGELSYRDIPADWLLGAVAAICRWRPPAGWVGSSFFRRRPCRQDRWCPRARSWPPAPARRSRTTW